MTFFYYDHKYCYTDFNQAEQRDKRKKSEGYDILKNYNRVNKSKRKRWMGHAECKEKMRNAYKIFNGKSQGKRQLQRCRHRQKTILKCLLRETGYEDMD